MDNVLFYLSFSLSLRLLSRGASRPVLETGQDLLYRYGFTPRKGPASNKNNHIAGEQSDVESFRAIQFTYICIYRAISNVTLPISNHSFVLSFVHWLKTNQRLRLLCKVL